MAYEPTVFRSALDFFGRLGIYDIVLPFLLIFAIVFGILEKTKILGLEKVGHQEYTRKNLNSIISFVIAFLVISSSQLVALINETLAKSMVILVLFVTFLILFGVFFGEKEDFFESGIKSYRGIFFIIVFVGIVLVALSSYRFESGQSLLEYFYAALWGVGSSTAVSAIILIIIMIGFMMWITSGSSGGGKKEDSHGGQGDSSHH